LGKKKVNVLFVLIELSTGGTERVVLDLAKHLDRSSFNVYCAFFADGPLREECAHLSQRLFFVRKKPGFDPAAIRRLSAIIGENNIDVINAHHYMPFFYSFLPSKIFHRRALIYTEHSVPGVEQICSSIHNRPCNLMLYDTNNVVAVSTEVAESLSENFPAHTGRIKYIPNGVDIARFSGHVDRRRIRSLLGLQPDHFVVGNVANFRQVKNHACLIRAFYQLSLRHPDVRLVLVGAGYPAEEGNTEQTVKRLISEYGLDGRVILTGDRQDIPQLLTSFDAFCLPSWSEGLPISILEAMAAKIPVVGSNVRGIRGIISPGETGLLFPCNDHIYLCHLLERLYNSSMLRQELCSRAFAYVSEAHGMARWITAYEELFRGSTLPRVPLVSFFI
jgi:glycosyltransferase involved in cell wall biosynthesis